MIRDGRVLRRDRRAGVLAALGTLLLYTALAVVFLHGTWVDPAHRSIGAIGDPQQVMWFLSWPMYAITHHHNPLITTFLAYPSGVNLMWNTPLTLPALVLWPVTAALGPVVAYNVLMTAAVALSAFTAYLAYAAMVGDRAAGAAGGLLYGFSPYMAGQTLGHSQMSLALLPPLMLLLLYRVGGPGGRLPPATAGVLLGLATAAQLMTSEEILFTTALTTTIGLVILLVARPALVRVLLRPALAMLPGLVVVFGALSAFPLYIQFFGAQQIHGPTHSGVGDFSSDLLNLLVPTHLTALNPSALHPLNIPFTGNDSENTAYLGLALVIVLAFVVLRWWRVQMVRWAAALTVIMFVLSMGAHLHVGGRDTGIPMPWLLLSKLPFGEHVLAVRLTLFAFLGAGLLVSIGLSRRAELGRWAPALVAAVAGALATLAPATNYPWSPDPVPAFFTSGARRVVEGSVSYVAPVGPGLAYTMLWQAESGMRFRMPTGYAFIPFEGKALLLPPSVLRGQLEAVELGRDLALDDGTRAQIAAEMRGDRVTTVIAGPMPNERQVVERITLILRSQPREEGGVFIWETIDPQRIAQPGP